MIEFACPWCFLLLPLPLLVVRFAPEYRVRQSAVQVPFFDLVVELSGEKPASGAVRLQPKHWQRVALMLTWLAIVTAFAKPLWLGEPQKREMTGRDVMVVMDLSGSMDKADFTVAGQEPMRRLDAVKMVLRQFASKRKGDRLGLILFGDAAYLQSPFTADNQAWLALVDEAEIPMAGQSTHLGDAVGLAIKAFADSEVEEKVAIVLTDGNDTDSLVPPLDAAKVAAARGIRLHLIAIGDPATVGEEALDMEVIERMASLTGGESFQALSPGELARVYQRIDELEPAQYLSVTYQPRISLHYLPVAIILVMYLLLYTAALSVRAWRARRA